MSTIRKQVAVLLVIAACSHSRDAGPDASAAQDDAARHSAASRPITDAALAITAEPKPDGFSRPPPGRCDGHPVVTAEFSRACFEGNVAAVRAMLTTGTANDRKDSCQFTPFAEALAPYIVEPGTPRAPERKRAERKLQVAHMLLDAGIDPRATDRYESTALHAAAGAYYAKAEVLQLVRRVLALRPPVNAQTTGGVTPLWLAAEKGQPEVVQSLLEAGADPSIGNARGVTPVELARQRGYADVERLLSAKLDPRKPNQLPRAKPPDASTP